MARPIVFLSSTFYDLRQVRADLEQFVREMGYEPVLNERGSIPYGSQEKLEEYAYSEVDQSDILVAIIGGRFGTPSQHRPYSISQIELQRAVDGGKQVYIFIEQSVHSEYSTYLMNKGVEGVKYRYVDDQRVYAFIEEVEGLPRGNPIATFETARDITEFLREQWSGLFQRFLQQQSLLKEARLLEDMQSTVKTLDQLVTFLTQERRDADDAVREILLRQHPIFDRLKALLRVQYRIFFINRKELNQWVGARGFKPVKKVAWDDPEVEEWIAETGDDDANLLKISSSVFETDGRLRVVTPDEWNNDWVQLVRHDEEDDDDDDDDDG